jgi:hypothetical protein
VLSVSCHPDGGAFASGSSDSKVKLWDLSTRTCSQTVAEHSDQVGRGGDCVCVVMWWTICCWQRVHVPSEAGHLGCWAVCGAQAAGGGVRWIVHTTKWYCLC